MKKLVAIAPLFVVYLWAADFWQAKPFTEWSDKDVQKMLQSSPWSHTVNVPLAPSPMPSTSGSKRSRTPGNMGELDPASTPVTPGIDDPSRAGTLGRGTGGADDLSGYSGPSVTVTVRWQSSLAVKQALIRYKYGNEAGTSPEARKMLEAGDPNYVVEISGIAKTLLPGDVKKALQEQSALLVKGRDPIKPIDIMTRVDKTIDAFIAFPRTQPFSADDKDVEFLTKLGSTMVRQRFHLKDMMLNGKLEL